MSGAAGGGPAPRRLSFNQITYDPWSLEEAVDACARAGVEWIAPWREKIAEIGLPAAERLVRGSGLKVSSVCRGGFFTYADEAGRRASDALNRAAVEEAAALDAECLVVVPGAPAGRDLAAARAQIADGLERLVPHAVDAGVRLAIEPLHPMMIGERSAVVTLGEANDLAERFDAEHVGVIVDVYHVFWDPQLEAEIARAGRRIFGYHVNDWLVPTLDLMQGRGMMGDGIIDLPAVRAMVERAGYTGPIEVEIINRELWKRPGDELLAEVRDRFAGVC